MDTVSIYVCKISALQLYHALVIYMLNICVCTIILRATHLKIVEYIEVHWSIPRFGDTEVVLSLYTSAHHSISAINRF